METNHCPTCGSSIPENSPGGFCPACLLRDADETPVFGPAAPSVEEVAVAFPRLEVMELIGQGGMGFVYKARQPDIDRTIALKILAPELGRDPAFAERFAREARTLGKLHHPNIVTVFEHGKNDGFFYLMMEYVDGVNLRQAMRAGRFTPEQALAIVPGICDALQYAHEQGVWHRDIKPENILLDRDGKVKIADFGIARIVGDPRRDFTLTLTGNALGSAAYMAPEQHEKPHDVDHRADIYSLGVVIYEMLTGELPLGRFPLPSQRAEVNARIDEIVLQTLEKERELRQQSAGEVKTDVHRALRPGEIQKFAPAIPLASHGSSVLAKLACGLLFGGALGFPLLSGIGMRGDFAAAFGVICVLLGCVLGVVTRRETLSKFVVLASGCLLVLCVLFATWNTPSLRVKREPPTTTITPVIKNEPVQNRDATPSPASQPPMIPPPPPITAVPAPVPTVSPEEVFRKANAAANESNGDVFKSLVWENRTLISDTVAGSGEDVRAYASEKIEALEFKALFTGEITSLKVVSVASGRVPKRNTFGPEGKFTPVAYATIRKCDGSLTRLGVSFRNKDGQWIGTEVWFPNYGAFSRIEFKPEKGDAATILKTHLGYATHFREVEGKSGQFDVFGYSEIADFAKANADRRVADLCKSLDRFDLGRHLKVISTAEKPALPYMGENEPPFDPQKP